jgi:hypothetical protein
MPPPGLKIGGQAAGTAASEMFRRSFLVATIILNQKKGQKGQVYFSEKQRALLRELFFLF